MVSRAKITHSSNLWDDRFSGNSKYYICAYHDSLEKIRSIGSLQAIGLSRRSIISLFLLKER
ncbi:MAG: hypothetical protein CM1200mP10_33370 [Candidatus Neomarinimicrobiota bacterium]|nr:MAG: hypothetical protein CM1200mP10_33370 [Candidatus Neomarinimicrobiota bacterium]